MRIFDFFDESEQLPWIEKIKVCDWGAARFLSELLEQRRFFKTLGEGGKLLMIADGDRLVSFVTLSHRDCIDDDSLYPWIGFVFTTPEYRGHRYSGMLIEEACMHAKAQGHEQVYIATDHVGLYEKYGFSYIETRIDIYNEESRIYCRKL